jgi:hypothetical protein
MLVLSACVFFHFQKVQRTALSGRYPPNANISFAVLFIISNCPEYVNRKLWPYNV